MLRRGSFTGTQRKTNQLKQVVGAPKPASSRLRILSQGTSRCARHFFPLPLLLASSARRLTRERSLEDPRNGGLREKPRRGGTALRHAHGPGLTLKGIKADLDDPASLKSVLRGCTGVFGVTDFWEAFLREYDQGVNLIDAASTIRPFRT